ncbi:unnamed protein product [Camellia sinensis]
MLLRRFEHEKQKLQAVIQTTKHSFPLTNSAACCIFSTDVLCRRSGFDSWQGTIPIIDNTSVFLDMELLQELSQIVLVDAEELQLRCFMPMEYRQLECNALWMAIKTIPNGYLWRPYPKYVGFPNFSMHQLVLSWHTKAATMCEFSKQEFIGGLQALGKKFREIYDFAFGWAKEKGQKSLALDTAIGMWQLLYEEKQWPLVDHWCQFLQ